MGVRGGDPVQLNTRRGHARARARADATLRPGQVFMVFCHTEAAANLLTHPALDPFAKIAELKFCTARIEAVPAMEGSSA